MVPVRTCMSTEFNFEFKNDVAGQVVDEVQPSLGAESQPSWSRSFSDVRTLRAEEASPRRGITEEACRKQRSLRSSKAALWRGDPWIRLTCREA